MPQRDIANSSQRIITVREAAEMLKCHPSTIYRLLKTTGFPGAFRLAKDWRIVRSALEDYMNEQAGQKRPHASHRQ